MRKLRINKNDVVIINTYESKRDTSGNRYFKFGECYVIRKGERMYFSDWLEGWEESKRPEWFAGNQWSNNIKPMINKYFPNYLKSGYISDNKNIVCFHTELKTTKI